MCDKIRQILTGEESTEPYHEFPRRNNQTDILILKTTKVCSPIRCKVTHPSNSPRTLSSQGPQFTTPSSPLECVYATPDTFLRDNLEWLALAQSPVRVMSQELLTGWGIIRSRNTRGVWKRCHLIRVKECTKRSCITWRSTRSRSSGHLLKKRGCTR